RAGFGITDDNVVMEAAKQEIIRRYFRSRCEYLLGIIEKDVVERAELLMENMGIKQEDRKVVGPARRAAEESEKSGKGNEGIFCGAALEMKDGLIITGKNNSLMHAASSLILNAIKYLANIPDNIHLLSPNITESIANFKKDIYEKKTASLDLEETLIALSISATTNPAAQHAVEKLKQLRNCEVHITTIPTPGDEIALKKLGVNLTSDPNFSTNSLFVA
ncbi:MAG: DUF1846 domain-containing protein, partial [bacterium]